MLVIGRIMKLHAQGALGLVAANKLLETLMSARIYFVRDFRFRHIYRVEHNIFDGPDIFVNLKVWKALSDQDRARLALRIIRRTQATLPKRIGQCDEKAQNIMPCTPQWDFQRSVSE